ncbi:hypothetical protein [Sporomusa sp.]|uniref:hypothetical protein n=1 Tax=Sporomusa sp. TaxID=2078658 RepID=UPI002B76254B|nr:hypothetical protein [Sporomusa sp.]HWR07114.1 hypothetical protein [Sporomusa sp.]
MPAIICSSLNQSNQGCTANLVRWSKGKCNGYITSAGGMKLQAPPMERKNGSLQNMRTRPR